MVFTNKEVKTAWRRHLGELAADVSRMSRDGKKWAVQLGQSLAGCDKPTG